MHFALIIQGPENSPPLILAIQSGKAAAVKAELAKGADPNAREILVLPPDLATNTPGGRKRPGDTALILAVRRYNMDMVRALLDKKADVNKRGDYGWTPLISACQSPNLDLVNLLLAKKADPNLLNVHGNSALVFAANNGKIEIVRALLKAGAKSNMGTGSPLYHAAQFGNAAMVDLLLKHGADPNRRSFGGLNDYEAVLQSDHFGMADKLRKAGGKGRSKAELDRLSEAQSKKWIDDWEKENRRIEAENPYARTVTEEDRQLIEAAILHLFFGADSEMVKWFDSKSRKVLLVEETTYYRTNDFSTQIDADLGEKGSQVTLEMRRDLRHRNTRHISLKGLKFSPEIVLARDKDVPGGRSWYRSSADGRGYAYAYLPGYSSARKKAVVRLSFGPSAHGASATYFFEKVDGQWKRKWHKLAYYV